MNGKFLGVKYVSSIIINICTVKLCELGIRVRPIGIEDSLTEIGDRNKSVMPFWR